MGVVKNFDQPDETRTFDRGRLDIVEVHGQRVGRAVFEPEWRWSAGGFVEISLPPGPSPGLPSASAGG